MALRIRLRQQGRTNYQTYRVVLADVRSPRDGKYLEMLGWYNPGMAENNVSVDADRIQYWVGQGAQISENVQHLLAKVAPAILQGIHAKKVAKKRAAAEKRKAK